jgi:hypothetical protein
MGKLHDFKYFDDNGKPLDIDGVQIKTEDGATICFRGRRTDGCIEVYVDGVLLVEPRASNLIYVRSERKFPK